MAFNPVHQQKSPIYTALKQIGLTDNEAGFYSLSLAVGPLPIVNLAEKMGIPRPNIYKLIKSLEMRGLAVMPSGGKLKRFSVLSPSIVGELLEKKQRKDSEMRKDFVSILPDLLAKYRRGDLPTNIRIYQGREQYRDAFYGMLDETKGSCDFFGSVDDFLNLLDVDDQLDWLRERVQRGITAKTLTLPGDHAGRLAGEDKEYLRETRILAGLNPFKTSFHLFADRIMLWQPEGLLAIRIEDDLMASMFRSIYDFLWEQAQRPIIVPDPLASKSLTKP